MLADNNRLGENNLAQLNAVSHVAASKPPLDREVRRATEAKVNRDKVCDRLIDLQK